MRVRGQIILPKDEFKTCSSGKLFRLFNKKNTDPALLKPVG